MEAVKNKWLWGIFISILTIFAMSHNANAITPVFNIDNYSLKTELSNNTDCNFANNTTVSGYGCVLQSSEANALKTVDYTTAISGHKGDLFVLYLNVYNYSTDVPIRSLQFRSLSMHYYPFRIKSFNLLSSQNLSDSSSEGFYYYENDGQGSFYGVNGTNFQGYYEVVIEAIDDFTNKKIGFGSGGSLPFLVFDGYVGSRVRLVMSNILWYEYVGSSENREQQEKTQEAVDDSQEAGGDSSQDAQTGTTGLLNAITGAVSVISSASPTNCKINGNMGNLDMGQLDLCANPAPAFIQTIGSLILILMCVPLAISLFNRFIAIFRSFQS